MICTKNMLTSIARKICWHARVWRVCQHSPQNCSKGWQSAMASAPSPSLCVPSVHYLTTSPLFHPLGLRYDLRHWCIETLMIHTCLTCKKDRNLSHIILIIDQWGFSCCHTLLSGSLVLFYAICPYTLQYPMVAVCLAGVWPVDCLNVGNM